ncbi:adenylate/guanylate cyclase domain-containing protein [Anaerolineales bacterium HSG25]|nr:adenylate/guanylate cyclase domain-containing protein [Anaerolineales bacterium HSG25]
MQSIFLNNLIKLGQYLTEPADTIQRLNEKRHARLLSTMLIPLALFFLVASQVAPPPDSDFFKILIPIIVIVYGVSRTKYYLFAGMLIMFLLIIFSGTSPFITNDLSPIFLRSELKWLALPLLFGGLCLPLRYMLPIMVLVPLGIITMPLMFTEIVLISVIEPFLFVSILSIFVFITISLLAHDQKQIEIEQKKSEALLLNILPQPIAEQLKESYDIIAHELEEVTILFADIVGFTKLASTISASELVERLNIIFSIFDEIAEKHKLEKIKTIGDAYMIAGGVPSFRDDHAEAVADMALDIQKAMLLLNQENSQNLTVRMGIHTGPVVAGVIGIKKFSYDVWGDTVNLASRMESHGIPDKIQVSEQTYELLKDKYLLDERGTIDVKGKGNIKTYLLLGKKSF